MQNQPSTISCKNCGHSYEGAYCSSCGQKHIDKRITLKDSANGVVDVIFNFERGMWFTIKMLLINPKKVVDNYLNGITRPYIHPFRFLFLWVTIQVFLMVSSGILEHTQAEMSQGMNEGMGIQQNNENKVGVLIQQKISQYMTILLVLSIPFLSLFTKVFFRKMKFNFAEHLVVNSFAYGQSLILTTLLLPLYFINSEWSFWIQITNLVISTAYMTYVYKSVFSGNIILVFIKSIIVMILWMVGVAILVSVAMILFLLYMAIVNPEFLQQIKGGKEQAINLIELCRGFV